MTKLHLHRHPKTNLDSILGTFCDAFPHASIWFPTTRPYIFFYLIGSREPQSFSPARIDAELGRRAVRESVAYLRFRTSADVLSCYLGDERDLRRYLPAYTPNSDMKPFVEFNLDPVHLVLEESFLPFVKTVRQGSLADHLSWEGLADLERGLWQMRHERIQGAASQILAVHGAKDILAKLILATDGLRVAPNHPTLLEQLDAGLIRMKEALNRGELAPAKAIADMAALTSRQPDLGFAWVVKSWAHRALGQRDQAVEAAQHAARGDAPVAAARTILAEFAVHAGKLGEADAHCRRALAVHPEHADAYRVLGDIAARRGSMADAVPHLERALALGSRDINVLNNLAWVLATHPSDEVRDGARAVELAERATRMRGIDAMQLLDTLAAAYAEAGRFDDAVAAAAKAVARLTADGKPVPAGMQKRLDLYERQKPFRDTP
ncbi:hypothetical protein HQ560_19820 [bacterium]|nr:hypothetical protein [bacterium]